VLPYLQNYNILEVLIPCQSNVDLMFGGITIICAVFGTLAGGLMFDKMTSTILNAFKVQLSISILIVKLHEFSYIFMYIIFFFIFLASLGCNFSWGYILFQRILLQKSLRVYSFLLHWRVASLCYAGTTIY
jgi:hypothetical protein